MRGTGRDGIRPEGRRKGRYMTALYRKLSCTSLSEVHSLSLMFLLSVGTSQKRRGVRAAFRVRDQDAAARVGHSRGMYMCRVGARFRIRVRVLVRVRARVWVRVQVMFPP